MISVPRYERDVTLSPEQQQLLSLQNQAQTNLGQLAVSQSARLQGLLGTNLNTEGLQAWATPNAPTAWTPDMFSKQKTDVENAMMARYRAQTDPQNQAQEAQLAARGLSAGGQAWQGVQDTQNRALTDAAYQSQIAGGQEQSRLLGEQRASDTAQQNYAGFLNNLRGSQLQERQTIRNAPINEISALMSGSQVTVPQFQQFSRQGVDSAPVGQYIYQDYQNRANQAANTNAGLFGLGGSILSLAAAPMTGGTSLFGKMMGY